MDPEQKQALELIESWQKNPLIIIKKTLGDDLWRKQEDIAWAVWGNRVVAVRSCHSAGKSFIAARIGMAWLCAWEDSVLITTAPTGRQVEHILWREMNRAIESSEIDFGLEPLRTKLHIGEKWFALGMSTKEPARFQGFHSERLLVIVDEPSGVEEDIFDAIDGLLTSENNKLLMIGNPMKLSGRFYDSFRIPGVKKIHISAFDTPNFTEGKVVRPYLVTPLWVEEKEERWGKDSPLYYVKVLGEFPPQEEDTLIPLHLIELATKREVIQDKPEKVLGIDVARFGDDKTIFLRREGNKVGKIDKHTKEDTMTTVGRAVAIMRNEGIKKARVDEIGVGAGVVDRMKEVLKEGYDIRGVNVAEAPSDKEMFLNLRAELWWYVASLFKEKLLSIPDDDELKSQLASVHYEFKSSGQLKIESKDKMKERGLKSPDVADALVISYADATGRGVLLEGFKKMADERRDELLGVSKKEYSEPKVPPLQELKKKATEIEL